jgi:hypothetical protein
MKNLKLLLLTLLSVLSFGLFSQVQVYTTATSGPNVCDGTASLDSSAITATNILWQGMGMIVNQGSYFVNFLCPGTYSVSFVTNNTPVTLTFTITAGCSGFGITTTSTNSSTATSCNGTITVNVNGGTAPYTYIWGTGTPITSNTATNLCPGNYVIEVIDANLCSDITNVDILDSSQTSVGDTIIVNGSLCPNPQGTIVTQVENCQFNYNSAYIAYLSQVIIPTNPMDSMIIYWAFIDTTAVMTYIQSYAPQVNFNVSGCYNFTLILHCSIKTLNVKTMIVNDSYNVTLSGINELTLNNKELIRVVDMMGRETKVQPNKLLIYTYSDGSKEIRYINE